LIPATTATTTGIRGSVRTRPGIYGGITPVTSFAPAASSSNAPGGQVISRSAAATDPTHSPDVNASIRGNKQC
jgi:hypothetical protein